MKGLDSDSDDLEPEDQEQEEEDDSEDVARFRSSSTLRSAATERLDSSFSEWKRTSDWESAPSTRRLLKTHSDASIADSPLSSSSKSSSALALDSSSTAPMCLRRTTSLTLSGDDVMRDPLLHIIVSFLSLKDIFGRIARLSRYHHAFVFEDTSSKKELFKAIIARDFGDIWTQYPVSNIVFEGVRCTHWLFVRRLMTDYNFVVCELANTSAETQHILRTRALAAAARAQLADGSSAEDSTDDDAKYEDLSEDLHLADGSGHIDEFDAFNPFATSATAIDQLPLGELAGASAMTVAVDGRATDGREQRRRRRLRRRASSQRRSAQLAAALSDVSATAFGGSLPVAGGLPLPVAMPHTMGLASIGPTASGGLPIRYHSIPDASRMRGPMGNLLVIADLRPVYRLAKASSLMHWMRRWTADILPQLLHSERNRVLARRLLESDSVKEKYNAAIQAIMAGSLHSPVTAAASDGLPQVTLKEYNETHGGSESVSLLESAAAEFGADIEQLLHGHVIVKVSGRLRDEWAIRVDSLGDGLSWILRALSSELLCSVLTDWSLSEVRHLLDCVLFQSSYFTTFDSDMAAAIGKALNGANLWDVVLMLASSGLICHVSNRRQFDNYLANAQLLVAKLTGFFTHLIALEKALLVSSSRCKKAVGSVKLRAISETEVERKSEMDFKEECVGSVLLAEPKLDAFRCAHCLLRCVVQSYLKFVCQELGATHGAVVSATIAAGAAVPPAMADSGRVQFPRVELSPEQIVAGMSALSKDKVVKELFRKLSELIRVSVTRGDAVSAASKRKFLRDMFSESEVSGYWFDFVSPPSGARRTMSRSKLYHKISVVLQSLLSLSI